MSIMTHNEIVKTCAEVDNLLCCVFSRRHDESYTAFLKFKYLSHNGKVNSSQRRIQFVNNSQIRFITIADGIDECRCLSGLQIGLAVMNGVEPSEYLKARMRVWDTIQEKLGFPKIVRLCPEP